MYADIEWLTAAGIDIVVVKSTPKQYFIGGRLFEYPEWKMLTDVTVPQVKYFLKNAMARELYRFYCRIVLIYQRLSSIMTIYQFELRREETYGRQISNYDYDGGLYGGCHRNWHCICQEGK